ncbi:hypothetical protein D3C72_1734950 [compost metagenome]
MGAARIFEASRIYQGTEAIAGGWLPSVQILGDTRALANRLRGESLRSVVESEPAAKRAMRARYDEDLKRYRRMRS